MHHLQTILKDYYWVFLAIFALMLRQLLTSSPEIVEQYYSRGFFVGIRYFFSWLTFISPIPLIYVFIITALFFLFRRLYLHIRSEHSIIQKIYFSFRTIFNFVAGLVFAFLFLWGFNYQRIPVEKQIGMNPVPLKVTDIKEELDLLTPQLIEARNNISQASTPHFNKTALPTDFEELISSLTQQKLKQLGYPIYANANARFLQPKGILLGINTAGIYFPFVGEPNIDGGLHPITQPFILSHEFTHAYGFGDEGTCNFIAYLACKDSNHPFIKYAGLMGYWRILAVNYKSYYPEKYAAFRAKLPQAIINDLDDINQTHDQYPEFFTAFRNMTYNVYLKAQGIDEGMENYNRILMLARAWRLKTDTK